MNLNKQHPKEVNANKTQIAQTPKNLQNKQPLPSKLAITANLFLHLFLIFRK
jgi:hypothetical protein